MDKPDRIGYIENVLGIVLPIDQSGEIAPVMIHNRYHIKFDTNQCSVNVIKRLAEQGHILEEHEIKRISDEDSD